MMMMTMMKMMINSEIKKKNNKKRNEKDPYHKMSAHAHTRKRAMSMKKGEQITKLQNLHNVRKYTRIGLLLLF